VSITGEADVPAGPAGRNRARPVAAVAVLTGAAAVGWALLRSGPRIPFPDSFYVTETWPFASVAEIQSYARSSPLSYWIIDLLGLNQSPALVWFRLAVALLGIVAISSWGALALRGSGQSARAFRVIALAPFGLILFTTLGSYDALTVLCFGVILFGWWHGSRWVVLLSGIPLGLQHFEQGIVGVTAMGLVALALADRVPGRLAAAASPFWALGGLLVGKALLVGLIALQGLDPLQGRSAWLTDPEILRHAVVGAVNFGPAFLASLFAGLWAFVILAVVLQGREFRRWAPIVAAIALLVVSATVTVDHTRVFAMSSIPVLALLVVAVLHRAVDASMAAIVAAEFMAWVIVPMNVQGTNVVYVDPMNALDQWLTLLQHPGP
jgi:hypothetical protein